MAKAAVFCRGTGTHGVAHYGKRMRGELVVR
jgi:hypothetical protein